jgi:hypothetical protein
MSQSVLGMGMAGQDTPTYAGTLLSAACALVWDLCSLFDGALFTAGGACC